MKEVFISDDGIQFDDKIDCMNHEFLINHEELKNIDFIDEGGNNLCKLKNKPEYFMEDDCYTRVDRIIVHNESELKALRELTDYTGFQAYDDINTPGTYYWSVDSIGNGMFVLVR